MVSCFPWSTPFVLQVSVIVSVLGSAVTVIFLLLSLNHDRVILIFWQLVSFLQIMKYLIMKRCSCQVFILQWPKSCHIFWPRASISFISFHIECSLKLPRLFDGFKKRFLSNSTLIQSQIMGCHLLYKNILKSNKKDLTNDRN